ncbi:phosphoglyceromutase [Ordospora colligata]|nr:phosphoglyceromutase [Ordospora colligata]
MRKVCLVVIDGWGHDENNMEGNAVDGSKCYWMRRLSLMYDSFLLYAHGCHVGLPDGQMGNSEVGHLTIGSGRVIEQDIVRIDNAIINGEMRNAIKEAIEGTIGRIHVVGMVSQGGVHSHVRHLKAILNELRESGKEVFVHCISDGRDTAPQVFLDDLNDLELWCKESGTGKIVSVAGRFYGMDRAGNEDRTDTSFKMMTEGENIGESMHEYVHRMYNEGIYDEMIKPALIDVYGKVYKRDSVCMFNFRADRMRQITRKFIENGNNVITMTEYDEGFQVKVLFRRAEVINTLAEVLDTNGIEHVHVSEKEKEAHVTYFLNGGREQPFEKQRTVIVPSPDVESFDVVPEMSSAKVTEVAIDEICKGTPFVVLNLAPPDMIGHTGNLDAAKEAVEAVDVCIGRLYNTCVKNECVLVITADHGNAEKMKDDRGMCCKTHTTNKVPLIVCDKKREYESKSWGYVDTEYSIRDIAPTVLNLMGIEKPSCMTGHSMI